MTTASLNTVPARFFLPALLLCTSPVWAAGPRDGVETAQAAASARLEGAALVEIEGFTDPIGDIPCAGKSFSHSWHYKFYSAASRQWLMVNACGTNLINVSRHFPAMNRSDPTTRVPSSFAAPAEILEKLAKAGAFRGTGSAKDRRILMSLRILPAAKGIEAACYWTVSQGRAKAVIDCAGKKILSSAGKTGAASSSGGGDASAQKTAKGKDTAGRYIAKALSTVGAKYPRLALLGIESLADRTGSAKCLDAGDGDGWTFTFAGPGKPSYVTMSACKGRTFLQETNFTGKTIDTARLAPIPGHFKNSDEAILKIPKSCIAGHSTFIMKLFNYSPAKTPVRGHSLLWEVHCGTLKYHVDAATGLYLGGGEK